MNFLDCRKFSYRATKRCDYQAVNDIATDYFYDVSYRQYLQYC